MALTDIIFARPVDNKPKWQSVSETEDRFTERLPRNDRDSLNIILKSRIPSIYNLFSTIALLAEYDEKKGMLTKAYLTDDDLTLDLERNILKSPVEMAPIPLLYRGDEIRRTYLFFTNHGISYESFIESLKEAPIKDEWKGEIVKQFDRYLKRYLPINALNRFLNGDIKFLEEDLPDYKEKLIKNRSEEILKQAEYLKGLNYVISNETFTSGDSRIEQLKKYIGTQIRDFANLEDLSFEDIKSLQDLSDIDILPFRAKIAIVSLAYALQIIRFGTDNLKFPEDVAIGDTLRSNLGKDYFPNQLKPYLRAALNIMERGKKWQKNNVDMGYV